MSVGISPMGEFRALDWIQRLAVNYSPGLPVVPQMISPPDIPH